ncbi:uncharacterized protein [Antedon mediterranea]|uniref:uncharacterized protein n=1 Tax=Antedon mediterranea TaxID=105859 RepID=UPI003AF8EF69
MCASGRPQFSSPKRSSRTSRRTMRRLGTRVDRLPHRKEDRRLATYFKPEESKQAVYSAPKVSDGDSLNHPSGAKTRRLGSLDRPERCVLSRSYRRGRSTLATFQNPRPTVPIRRFAVRPIDGSTRVYTHSQNAGVVLPQTWNKSIHVSRRLVGRGPVQGQADEQSAICPSRNGTGRFHCQSGEVVPGADTAPVIPRSTDKSRDGLGVSIPTTHRVCNECSTQSNICSCSDGLRMAQSTGLSGQLRCLSSVLPATYETFTAASAGSLPTAHRLPTQSGSVECIHSDASRMVAGRRQVDCGNADSKIFAGRPYRDRRIRDRLGRLLQGTPRLRPLDGQGGALPHQPPRTLGSRQDLEGPSTSRDRSSRPYPFRQHNSGSIYKSSGRHEVTDVMLPPLETDDVVHRQQHQTLGCPHCGQPQHCGGRSVPTNTLSHGMAPSTQHCHTDIRPLRAASYRSVCDVRQHTAPDLLHKVSGCTCVGGGCPIHTVGRTMGLCVSTDLTNTNCSDAHSAPSLPGPSDRPGLGSTSVVSTASRPALRSSPASSSSRGSADAGPSCVLTTEPTIPAPDCMAIVRDQLRDSGIPDGPAALAAKSRRESTLTVYNSRLKHFFTWCRRQQITPGLVTLGQVCAFLHYLFESGLQVRTISGYRSAIGAVTPTLKDGSTISSSSVITQLIRGMFRQRPPVKVLIPRWDVNVVLAALTRPPFEPMSKASLYNLSLKTAFLLALSSCKRRGELHALTLEPGHVRFERGGVRLVFRKDFLAKTQTLKYSPPAVFVPTITSYSAVDGDKLWCPVRALKWYIHRTKTIRDGVSHLFVTSVPPHRAAAKSTIARWVVSTIQNAYTSSDTPPPAHMHQLRAVATSWALFAGVPVADIMEAAWWRTQSTFTSYYLSDVSANLAPVATAVLKPRL